MPRCQATFIALVVALCFSAEITTAATPRENFESDEVLSKALMEISRLSKDQLEAVISYIATCNPTPAPERDFPCERAKAIVEIKTRRSTSLSDIIFSIDLTDRIIPWKGTKRNASVIKDLHRRIDVFRALSRAASIRYAELAAENERK